MKKKEGRGESFLVLEGIRVEERIFTTPYICDPALYGCQSQCCYRGCILSQAEIERIGPHLQKIAAFLPPDKRKALLSIPSFVADCSAQCPEGCEIHGLEWEAVRLHFPEGDLPRCLPYPDQMCLFAYSRDGVRLCAIHSYALQKGMDLTEIKPLDCIQYPLYLGEDEKGRYLAIQETPYLSHIPCMRNPRGEPMILSLGYAIEALLGKEFYRQLLLAFRQYVRDPAHHP
jgi:hypothetical protein